MIANDIRFAVGYARRSTDLQERSLPDQKAAVERWARDHGYRILRWFVDDAISGTSARGRDQFTRLIHEAENGRDFDAVLCYDMSRFSRGGTNETGYYIHRLRLAGVETHFTAEGIPEGDEGELLQGVKSWQARQYSVKLSRDSIRGQHSTVTVKHSAMGGRSPYGYDRQYVSANGQVLKTVRTLSDGRRQEFGPDGRHLRFIDPKEKLPKKMKSDIVRLIPGDPKHIAVVRDIFDMCAKGLGFRSILIALNAKGIEGPMHARWNQMAVKSILQNPCYRGALAWNRRTFGKIHEVASDGSAIPKKMAKTTRNPKDRWIVIENVHEAIVPPDLFWKAHEQMAKRRNAGGLARPTQRYLLSGLVRCKHCCHNFWGCVLKNSAGEIRYYADGGYRAQGIGVCKATHIQAAALDRWVLEQLRTTFLADKAGVERAIEQFVKAACGRGASAKAQPDRSRELADLNKRIKTTVALLSDSDLADVGELRAALVDLKRRRETLEADVANKPASPKSIDPDRLRAWARERIADLARALKPGTPMMEARAAVHAFIPKIEIDPDRKVGTLFLPRDTCSALQSAFVRRDTSASPTLANGVFVGTGYALANGEVTLVDANADSLNLANRRMLLTGTDISAGTFSLNLETKLDDYVSQYNYWQVYLVQTGTNIALDGSGTAWWGNAPPGAKLVTQDYAPPAKSDGSWYGYTNNFTVSAADAAQYNQIVVLMGGSRKPTQQLGWRSIAFTKN